MSYIWDMEKITRICPYDIVSGKINSFREFAKKCLLDFTNTEGEKFEPKIPADFYRESLIEAEKELNKIKGIPDDIIIGSKIVELKKLYTYYQSKIEEYNNLKRSIEPILSEAKAWNPPTEDHYDAKRIMIEKLEEMLGENSEIRECQERMDFIISQLEAPMNVKHIRIDMIKKYKHKYFLAKKELAKATEKCEKTNRWSELFLESLGS